jgi:hypothetical protein
MSGQEQYYIADITFRSEDGAAAAAAEPVTVPSLPPLSASADLKRSIADWSVRHEFDLGVFDVLVDTDEDDDVRIILPDLTIDSHGDIVTKKREYVVTGRFHVEAQVTVTASSEDEARELADDEFGSVSFDFGYGDVEVTDVQFDEVLEVDEQ